MTDPSSIRRFVRETLGCQCPDEVFERIEHARNASPTRSAPYVTRLVIGDRLLIYLLPRTDVERGAIRLSDLFSAGRNERDAHGLNRFRAVLVGDGDAAGDVHLREEWMRLAAGDERIHLHLEVTARNGLKGVV